MRKEWWGLSILLMLWACGNTGDQQVSANPIVARVSGRDISVQDFDRMAVKLLNGPYRDLQEIDSETREKLLDAMIGKELLIEEAGIRGLDRDSASRSLLDEFEINLLTRRLYDSQAFHQVDLSEEEIERFFHQEGYDEEVRFSHIMCPTEEAAARILVELERGESFEVLASERSIHFPTARKQGDMGYVPVAQMLSEVRDVVLGLEIGQTYLQPVKSRYGFHVFKLTARRTVELDERREIVKAHLNSKKRSEQISQYMEHLKGEYGLKCDTSPLAERHPAGNEWLCVWRGDSLTVAEYFGSHPDEEKSSSGSPDELAASLEAMAARRITKTEARRLGLHLDESVVNPLRRRREELLVKNLEREVTRDIAVAEEEVRTYFDAHPERYGSRPTVLVQEILVADEERARELRRRIENGEEMAELASQFHTRKKTQADGGKMWLKNRENVLLGPLAPLALDSPVGKLHGPLQVPGGYSLFRVEEKKQLPARRLAEVRRTIRMLLELKSKTERMELLLEELRVKYANELEIFPEALALTLKDIDLAAPANDSQATGWSPAPDGLE